MLITHHEMATENLKCLLPLAQLDAATIVRSREIFTNFQQKGIVLNASFDDEVWELDNEVEQVTLSLPALLCNDTKKRQNWLGIEMEQYTEYVKSYLVLKFGHLVLRSFCNLSKLLMSLPNMSIQTAAEITHNTFWVAEFLSLLPNSTIERDCVMETLSERVQTYRKNSYADSRRVLAAFNSYLRFNEVLSDYWLSATAEEKLLYFPIYFWWNLTAILPLRPTEFLLTPRDCLDENILTIRRTRLKGIGGKVAYRIAQDYELHKYEITSALAFEIRNYIALTEHMPETSINTLLRPQNGTSNSYYNYKNMYDCLDMFLIEVVKPCDAEITQIKLGDTRHLAMINLIISGGSPTICKELAGHANIGISSHYYSNIANLVECITVKRFRKSKRTDAEFAGEPRYPLKRPDNMTRLDKGWCDAESLKSGDVSECMKVVDEQGRIGECSCCGHYWPDIQGMRFEFFDYKEGKQRVDLDSAFLIRMIEIVRKGIGYDEDITSALLRLQRSCNHYGDCLTLKYLNAEAI